MASVCMSLEVTVADEDSDLHSRGASGRCRELDLSHS